MYHGEHREKLLETELHLYKSVSLYSYMLFDLLAVS